MTTIEALKKLHAANGDNPEDLEVVKTIPEAIACMAYAKVSHVTVAAMSGAETLWGHTISDLQTGVTVSDGAITGTLHKVTSGSLVDVWGEGWFIALTFTPANNETKETIVGLRPSEGSGLVPLDEDMAAVCKVTDKSTQVLVVRSSDGVSQLTETYDLSGLTLD